MKNRADEVIYLMRQYPGHAFSDMKACLLMNLVRYEWNSNRWAMVVDEDNRILGWMSWYCFDTPSLLSIRDRGLVGCYYQNIPLNDGQHVFVCNSIVRPGQPVKVFRNLRNMVYEANKGKQTINAWLCNRKNQQRWFCKPISKRRQKCQDL
ncbi:hypothetical protein CI610_01749 [invertebrate metagenome]|uniref:Uncharacterized protein n=1 Tax=invertebrate metagenome TaxID=1711999 RepID=A0A2H9T7V0_9ZZZZ